MSELPSRRARKHRRLPDRLRPFFWDHMFRRLTWRHNRDLVIGRILAAGDWEALKWLRRRLGDGPLRDWLLQRRGAGLNPRQLRFWEAVLDLPRQRVSAWLSDGRREIWDRRRHA